MFSILSQHPQIVAPCIKEPGFFYDREIVDGVKYGDFAAYHSIFPLPFRMLPGKITFEANPEYLIYPECPQRIYDYAPGMKLIVILRDPIARAYSCWNMFRKFAISPNHKLRALAENRPFEDAITAEIRWIEQGERTRPWNYVRTGMYVEHLQRYFQYFPRNSMLISDYADFLHTPEPCLAAVCQFLGIDSAFKFRIVHKNVSSYESKISQKAVNILLSFYKPLNESLSRLLAREFKW